MSSTHVPREARRSTRVRFKVVIEARGVTDLICDGETAVVNLHGALISTEVQLRKGMKIQVHVIQTNTRATADVVHLDADRQLCGIELGIPENIWGVSLPPEARRPFLESPEILLDELPIRQKASICDRLRSRDSRPRIKRSPSLLAGEGEYTGDFLGGPNSRMAVISRR